MRPFYRRIGNSVAAINLATDPQADRSLHALSTAPAIEIDLPAMQQLAMMTMHESPVARTVARRLREHVQDKPSWIDYRALKELGYCDKRPNDSWHRLTFEGIRIAKELESMPIRLTHTATTY